MTEPRPKTISEQLRSAAGVIGEWGWPKTAALAVFVAGSVLLGVLGGSEYRDLVAASMGSAGTALLLSRRPQ